MALDTLPLSRAEKPAAIRMAQRTRLAELEAKDDGLGEPEAEAASAALKAAADAVRAARRGLRRGPPRARRRSAPWPPPATPQSASPANRPATRTAPRGWTELWRATPEGELTEAQAAVAAAGSTDDGDAAPLMTQLAPQDHRRGGARRGLQARVAFNSEARDRQPPPRPSRLFDLKHNRDTGTPQSLGRRTHRPPGCGQRKDARRPAARRGRA